MVEFIVFMATINMAMFWVAYIITRTIVDGEDDKVDRRK